MISKVGFGIILFIYFIGSASCSKVSRQEIDTSGVFELASGPEQSSETDPGSEAESELEPVSEPTVNIAKWDELAEITYYRGGWFGLPGFPNWSHYITFAFNADETIEISAKLPEDPNCIKVGTLAKSESEAFLIKVNGLVLGQIPYSVADAGVTRLVIKFKTGEEKIIYLPISSIGQQKIYATAGGYELRDHIIEIYNGLTNYCP